jgi:tetratricopeptide (TPR) repeat protein
VIGKANVELAQRDVPGLQQRGVNTPDLNIRYRASKYAEAARNNLMKATSLEPDFAPAHERLARHHANSGNWADALLAADDLVRLMPRSGAAFALRAGCYRELDQLDSGRNDLEVAVALSPRDATLHYELARVLADLGDYDEAVAAYTTALSCDAEAICDCVHYHLGIAYRKSGNLEKARDEFTTAKALGWPAAECDAELAACGQRQVGRPYSANARLLDVSVDRADVDETNVTVYVTKTGKKYHSAGCRHLSRSKIPLPLDEAAKQYGPCSHCRPPTP